MQAGMQADLEKQGMSANIFKSRLYRAGSSADNLKGSLLSPEERVNQMPAPYGTMEANKLLGDKGRLTVDEATQARKEAMQPKFDMNAPWGGRAKPYTEAVQQFVQQNTEDLTPILEKSVKQAKAKRAQTRKPPVQP